MPFEFLIREIWWWFYGTSLLQAKWVKITFFKTSKSKPFSFSFYSWFTLSSCFYHLLTIKQKTRISIQSYFNVCIINYWFVLITNFILKLVWTLNGHKEPTVWSVFFFSIQVICSVLIAAWVILMWTIKNINLTLLF